MTGFDFVGAHVGLAGPEEAEARLVGMIDKGRIFARIDQVSESVGGWVVE